MKLAARFLMLLGVAIAFLAQLSWRGQPGRAPIRTPISWATVYS